MNYIQVRYYFTHLVVLPPLNLLSGSGVLISARQFAALWAAKVLAETMEWKLAKKLEQGKEIGGPDPLLAVHGWLMGNAEPEITTGDAIDPKPWTNADHERFKVAMERVKELREGK